MKERMGRENSSTAKKSASDIELFLQGKAIIISV